MKKIASSLVLFALLAVTLAAFAQTPQTTGTSQAATEIAAPDLSKLHALEGGKKFFVQRGDKFGWTKEKQDGDILFVTSQYFTQDESSTEITVAALYALDEKEPCAISWKEGEGVRFSIVLENGKTVTTENGKVGFEAIRDDKGFITGVRFFLYSGDDPNTNRAAQRDFLLKN